LGSGDFVETILGNSSDTEPRRETRISLELLGRKVAFHFNLKEDDLRSPVKRKSIVEAKSAFGYIAIKQMGYSGREVGRFLNMRSYSAIGRPARFAFDSENNLKYDSSRMIIIKMAYRFALADGAQEGRKVIEKKEFLWDLAQE
jgi:hypothetical protein